MNVLIVSPDPELRDLLRLTLRGIERRLGEPVGSAEAIDGDAGARLALASRPDAVIADEIASRAGAFAMAKTLRGDPEPFVGPIVILLERKHDAWLARWSGADAWFVKPVDPFELTDRLLGLLEGRAEKETV